MNINNNKRRGIAIVVVLFFAFSISIMLFFMSSSNTNLSYQNKKAIRQMQAYYLAQSAMQHAKLQLKLLPKETYDFMEAKKKGLIDGNPFINIDSTNVVPLSMGGGVWNPKMAKYDLYTPAKCEKDANPYAGRYWVDSIELNGAHNNMRMVQDGYKIVVKSEIDGGRKVKATDMLSEIIIVSRFTGGIK